MADVPRHGGQGPLLRVHDGVLDDVRQAGHVLGEVALHPARRAAGLGHQTSGMEAVARRHLAEDDVFR